MLIIQEVLVTDEVVDEQFMCNLNACKGACCWEGDFGAPLEKEEMQTLEAIYDNIKSFLSPEGRALLEAEGIFTYYQDMKGYGTPLIEGRDCAYLTYDDRGIAKCGIEAAYEAGASEFKKPLSCHLYPVRIDRDKKSIFEVLRYDRWDICTAACSLGKKEKMPVYRFVKDALIRRYGEAFYDELEHAVQYTRQD